MDRAKACLEFLHFFVGEFVFHHFFHTIDADESRDAYEDIVLAVFAVQFYRAGEDAFFIVEDGAYQGSCGGSDAVLGTEFPAVGDPAAFDGGFLYFVFVKDEARVFFHVGQWLAIEIDDRPGNDLGRAVFAQHEGEEATGVEARLVGNRMNEAGGVEQRAGAQDLAAGKSGELGDEVRDHITRIGDGNENAMEAAGHDLRNVVSHLAHAIFQFIIPISGSTKRNVAHCIDDDVAILQARIVCSFIYRMVRHVHHSVIQVLTFADGLRFIQITKQNFIRDSHHAQTKCHMSSHMAQTHNANNSFLQHKNTLLLHNPLYK